MAENTILALCFPCPTPAQAQSGGPVDEVMTTAFQQLCLDIGLSHNCQAILDVAINSTQAKKRLSIETHQSVYNVTITGAYQNVMAARGAFMRSNPLKPRLSIKISKASITADPYTHPGSSSPKESASKQQESSLEQPKTVANSYTQQQQSEDTTAATSSTAKDSSLPVSPNELTPASTSISVTPNPIPLSAATTTSSISSYFTVLPKFKSQVDLISSTTRTTITLVSSQFHTLPSAKSVVAAHARQEMVELLVSGSWENAEAARLLLLVAINSLQPGSVQEKIQIELKYQNMVGGRKREDLQELMAKTRTSIYMASPFAQTTNKSGSPVDPRYNDVYITGEHSKVQIVKDVLSRTYSRVQSAAPACTRQVNIASRKLDWMMLNHRDKLRSIMIDNASFIAFPPLGASHPIIFVYGESRVNVERTIRTVMQLSSQFHSGSINLLSPVRESLTAIPLNPSNALSPIANISKLVSQASGAEVEFRNNGFYIFGNEIQTRIAVQFLTDIDFIKTLHYEVKFSVELANEHREFISGKKNGKINRIMKATGAKIKFDPCNEYNFYVDLSSTIAVKSVEALALLQEELPAEISFYVPETYHKRIIGVGGKNIQRIMKKFGVYVKFSNSEEFANLGGYFDNLDNVVARTPSKNAMNLDNLKHAVMELVNLKDKDFVHHSLSIPKHYHLSLLSDHAKALAELQEATNATVRFPEKETGSDVVWISGPESLIQQATSMLLSLVDEQYAYPVPFSEAMDRVLLKPEFKVEILDRMRNEWNMTLVPPAIHEVTTTGGQSEGRRMPEFKTPSPAGSISGRQSASESPKSRELGVEATGELARSLSSLTDSDDDDDDSEEDDHVFIFKYSRNNEDYLQSAKELLVQFLIDNQIEVYDDEIRIQRPRSDSFAEAFPHFNSKILSSVTGGDLPTPAPAFLNYSLFENAGNAFETLSRAPGAGQGVPNPNVPAGSMVAPDIRALFSHGPAQGLPPLASSPPRWPEQHSRQLTSIPGLPSGMTTAIRSVPSFAPSQPSNAHPGQNQQQQNQSPSFNRLTSLPIDPWASPGKQQAQVMQAPSTPGYTGSVGQFRTPPPGISSVGANNAFYSPSSGQSQQNAIFSPEGPYGGVTSFQTPGSTVSSNHLYSNNNSPVQGVSSNVGSFASMMNQYQTPHHQPSPQRPYSGSSGSRDSLQFLDEKHGSSPAFGSGYGPALNSGSNNNRYQQQQTNGQGYQSSSAFGQSLQYPQQRQRHSSHNSTTSSHHTMFLGPIGGGLGSTGGSVNSDDISTEDESDDPFDEMRNRHHRSYHHTPQYQPSSQQQGVHGGVGMFGSQASMSSVLANRRGSVPLMGSIYSNQLLYRPSSPQHYQLHHQQAVTPPPPHNVVRLSNSTSDLYGRKSLISAMARHTLNDTTSTSGTNTGNNSGFNSPGRGTPISGSGAPGPMTGFSPGFRANGNGDNERDLFSSGLSGIIGGGTISHNHSHDHSSPFNHHTHTNLASQINDPSGGYQQSSNAYDFIKGGGVASGVGALGSEFVGGGGSGGGGHLVGSSALMGSTLSASALPFLADSALDRPGHHQPQQQQQQQQRMVGGWDR
ncbi:hypothetical protein KI688_008725 [Linnemannia hyalina]|uniref:K Homology domain-containing protein n=1 Tax=Linnemannia hyalina TaxID=64524 RepID=A0A9P7Y1F7_9FUNG|nr:hypothetical protein KI688_008725 [Linnemannia hyalina]